jgi:hypothetical protein
MAANQKHCLSVKNNGPPGQKHQHFGKFFSGIAKGFERIGRQDPRFE